jgi:hypothetical protein
MGNHLKVCGHPTCRKGKRTALGKALLKRAVRRIRHTAKRALRAGREVPQAESVTHLD